jgi:hypothetical protein
MRLSRLFDTSLSIEQVNSVSAVSPHTHVCDTVTITNTLEAIALLEAVEPPLETLTFV